MRDIELLYMETHKPHSIDTVGFQDAQDRPQDEIQQGEGNVLGIGGIGSNGEVGGDGYDDDYDKNKKKYSNLIDKILEKEEATTKEEEDK